MSVHVWSLRWQWAWSFLADQRFMMMNLKKITISLALVLGHSAGASDLTVSAAASLTHAFQAMGAQFEAQNPGTKVRFNFGASGALLQQIVNGAPVDVFASADTDTMDKAVAKAVVHAADRKVFTTNRLVLITPVQSGLGLKQLADLKKPEVKRFAMGVPASVPAGHYTQDALEKAGLWTELKPKVISTQNVRQALDYVVRGEVDAGFVYASDAQLMSDKVKVAFPVATSSPIQYPIAIVAASANPAQAGKFMAWVQSPQGQAVLKKHGFGQ